MAKKDLIATAQSLGLDTEGLNVAQLEKVIADNTPADTDTETASKEENSNKEASTDTPIVEKGVETKEILTAKDSDNKTVSEKLEFEADQIKEILEKAIDLGIKTRGISFEEVLTALEEKDAKMEEDAKEKEKAEAAKFLNSFELDGKIYGLSDLTPKTLKVIDDVYTQEELLKNKEAMEFLIIGKSCFIKRLK